MAQDKKEVVIPAGQEEVKALTTENSVVEGVGTLVRPKDDVTVYATKKLEKFYKVGEAMTVHSELAKKLVKSGKATEKAPKEEK